jgi:hypothetical protein
MKFAFTLATLLLAFGTTNARPKPKPHYTFILPDGYIGWVQIIFHDRQASPLPIREDGGRVIEVPESGLPRTSDFRHIDGREPDAFYYRSILPDGSSQLRPMPPSLTLPDVAHGGWDVNDTGGRGPGYSWFIFFGPPDVRARTPWGDITKVPGYGKKLMAPDVYPTPGRLPATLPTRPSDASPSGHSSI